MLQLILATGSLAQIIVDDTWADGTRNNTSLPTESAWYASTAAALTSSAGSLTGTTSTSSRTWWTYFTTTPASPAQLLVGQTLRVTLTFIPTGVNTSNTSAGLRIGLYNYSAGTQTTSDGNSPNGTNASGYMLNMNFGQTFGMNSPLQIKKRTTVTDTDLMGTSSDYTQLAAGGGNSGDLAFTEGGTYTMVFSVTRTASSVDVTTTFTGSNGLNVTASASDASGLVDAFDTFSIRPANTTQTSASFQFTECKVEVLSVTNQPPSITTQPQSQSVTAGQTASFTVAATSGSTMTYQWFKDTQAINGATSSTLTLASVQSDNAGSYTVTVTNSSGPTTSNAATLTVNNAPPVITTQPQSQTLSVNQNATFSVVAGGSQPFAYQWKLGGSPISGATNSSYTIANVQASDAGSYTVTVANSASSITSNAAILAASSSSASGSFSQYNLTGYATVSPGTTGGGVIPDTDSHYLKVYTPLDFANALATTNKTAGAVRVIEIMNDLNLGFNEVGSAVHNLASTPFVAHNPPQLHPVLLGVGVSNITVAPMGGGLTIFSANGSTIRHATFNIKGTSNVIIRNLKFDEMWEWDEATNGGYDMNDWDFIDLSSNATNVWLDHCTFTKTYDGIVDMKAGSTSVTMSWCKYTGDDGASNPNSWVRQQLTVLEANRSSYAFYNFLRTNGYSVENIVQIIQAHDKTHLLGSSNLDPNNANISATFHHQWFQGVWDRCVPRLRSGNIHNYNIYVDDTNVLAALRLRNSMATTMSTANQNTLNNTYSFKPPINGSISTENGAVLVEKSVYIDCLSPLRDNQTDVNNPAYTGKIKALDTIYSFHNPTNTSLPANGTTTTIRGDSTDAGNPMGPFQATTHIPFSWNNSSAVSQPPSYSYTPDDPANLLLIEQAGAGAGKLTWDKSNWLKINYQDPPAITTQPVSQSVGAGSNVTLTVVASGTGPLSYQWKKNNVAIAGGTNSTLTLNNVQLTDSNTYRVVVSNSVATINSGTGTLTVTPNFVSWQQSNFTTEELAIPAISEPSAILGNDGITNLEKYALGLPARGVVSASSLPSITLDNSNAPVFTYKRLASATDVAYHVQVSTDLSTWSEANVSQQRTATGTIETWQALYTATVPNKMFFRLQMIR